MSEFNIIQWAMRQKTARPATKLVLMTVAGHANTRARAWPSIAQLVECTGIHRKGVMRELKALARAGLIEDTTDRRGQTGQIKVWKLNARQAALPLTIKRGKSPHIRDSLQGRKESLRGNGSYSDPKESLRRDTEHYRTHSDTNVSGGEAADPVKELFDLGVRMLTGTGVAEPEARSLIGKWRKGRTDGEILTGLVECRARAISNPKEWLTKRFKAAHYVSATGYEYRGTREQVKREAERRHDMGTYWGIMREERQEAEARTGGHP